MELIEKHASFGGWQNVYRHYSQSLKCEMNVGVYLPPKAANEKLPVLYWLSGLTCNDENFTTSVTRLSTTLLLLRRTPVREAVMSQMLTVTISGKVPGFT